MYLCLKNFVILPQISDNEENFARYHSWSAADVLLYGEQDTEL